MNEIFDFDKIVDEIHKLYESKYPSKCKPNLKVNEGTIIASIFTIDEKTKDTSIITLTSGVKCLNEIDLQRENVNGWLIHDSHAEILSLRCFNLYLLNLMKQILTNEEETSFNSIKENQLLQFSRSENKFKWNNQFKIGLYISQIPCGDCSILCEEKEQDINNQKHEKWEDDHMKQYLVPTNKTILRGRNNISKSGHVRSKPGRMDSIPSFSKSCTDKLIQKQSTGITNCLSYDLFDKKQVFLDYLVFPKEGMTEENEQDVKSCFKRITTSNPFEVVFTNKNFKDALLSIHGNTSLSTNASGLMLLKLDVSSNNNNNEYTSQGLQDGVKLGYTTKLKNPLRRNCQSSISRYEMYKLYLNIKKLKQNDQKKSIENKNYLEFKDSLTERCDLIKCVRELMSPDGWVKTSKDDFKVL
ncbi:hypothetical protein HANVADRAFT_53102 [Hanseniaspora valbyensis NRRL Y-1626]|uniref:A to I editase domain-containing protein n=1 Tax=Hanseniaspora valbyensis NRRL Y-1626 TaxID=766949 RepID=A0A1B7TCM1_9ASCO|nr:hypothetical protein HANVADRAFT_53102 [Hanseniaspora valbyensis NRRL Y-1626]